MVGDGRVCAAHGESPPLAQRAAADCAALFNSLGAGAPPAGASEASWKKGMVVQAMCYASDPCLFVKAKIIHVDATSEIQGVMVVYLAGPSRGEYKFVINEDVKISAIDDGTATVFAFCD